MGVHGAPAALALLLNGTLGGLGTQVVGDDRTSGLHVQEVRCQGTLGRVGVVSALLALLLLVGSRGSDNSDGGQDSANIGQETGIEATNKLIDAVDTSTLTEQEVGLAEVLDRELLQQILDGRETRVNLIGC